MIDSETRILAGILPDLTARMEKAQERLVSADNFDHPNLRMLWRVLDAYYDDHMAIVPEWVLKEKISQMQLGGAKEVALVEVYRTLSKINVQEHEFEEAISIAKEDELTRRTSEAVVTAREILKGEYYDEKTDQVLKGQEAARSFMSEALQNLETLRAEYAPEGEIADDAEKLWAEYLKREENPDEAAGIKYGIAEIDEFTGGIRPGEVALFAGFTGSGKSHFATALSWSALLASKNVLMFTTETTREEMEIRILARHSRLPKFRQPSGIDSHDIMAGTLPPADKAVFKAVLDDFKARAHGNLFMVQMPMSGSMDYVYAKANQYNRKTPIDLIIIDSINLLRLSRKYPSKREMLEEMLQDVKRFASAFDNGRGVAVGSPWQMSRDAWKTASEAGGVYTLASLSDTSEAEKSASQIISIFKDDDPGNGGRLNIQVLKNRSGREMPKVSYPYDYRNSYIGTSSEAPAIGKPTNNHNQVVQDIASMMGG